MRSGHDLLVPAADLSELAPHALADAARRANLDDAEARLIRLFSTAVYHLPAADAVARIALVTSPQSVTRLATSVRVTRWLDASGFPAVEPAARRSAGLSHGCAITFWRYLPQHGPAPGPADLGYLLRRLHTSARLRSRCPPTGRSSRSAGRSKPARRSATRNEPGWRPLRTAAAPYDQLDFDLPPG